MQTTAEFLAETREHMKNVLAKLTEDSDQHQYLFGYIDALSFAIDIIKIDEIYAKGADSVTFECHHPEGS